MSNDKQEFPVRGMYQHKPFESAPPFVKLNLSVMPHQFNSTAEKNKNAKGYYNLQVLEAKGTKKCDHCGQWIDSYIYVKEDDYRNNDKSADTRKIDPNEIPF